jgi:hypothetical protein
VASGGTCSESGAQGSATAIPVGDASVDVVVSGLVLNFVPYPRAAPLDEGLRFPRCRPEALETLFSNAGLTGIGVGSIDSPTPFASFDDYWQPFLGGQGPAPTYAMSLDDTARARLRDSIRARLPIMADGSISLTARAWAIRGAVAP